MAEQRRRIDIPLADFLANPISDVPKIAGTAVYLTSDPTIVPSALFHNLKHYRVMHERTVFLNVVNEDVPWIAESERVKIERLTATVFSVSLRFGFREDPDVPTALQGDAALLLQLDPMSTTYFIARSMIVDGAGAMPAWRAGLFSWMTRQSESAASYFRLPANQVVELGTQVML